MMKRGTIEYSREVNIHNTERKIQAIDNIFIGLTILNEDIIEKMGIEEEDVLQLNDLKEDLEELIRPIDPYIFIDLSKS